MGVRMYPVLPGDMQKYPIHDITSSLEWQPKRHRDCDEPPPKRPCNRDLAQEYINNTFQIKWQQILTSEGNCRRTDHRSSLVTIAASGMYRLRSGDLPHDDDDAQHKMSGGSPVQWLGSLLSPSAARRAAAIPLSEANTDADDTDAEEGAPNDEPREVATAAASPSPGLFGRFLRRSPSPGKTRMDISPGALENPRVSRIRAESGDEGGGMSRGTSSENLSVMTGPDSPPSEGAASSLPGADEFLYKADKRLEIKVEKSWFGLGSSPSPVRIKVRTGGTSDESSDDAREDREDESPTSKMTAASGAGGGGRTPRGSASKKWPSPASVVKSASRAEHRAAAEFIAAAEEAARRSASTTPGKGGKGGSAVQSPAQRREERKRRAEAEAAAAARSPYSDATGGSLTTGGGLPTGSDFFNQATQEKSWMQGLGSPSPSSKRRDAP